MLLLTFLSLAFVASRLSLEPAEDSERASPARASLLISLSRVMEVCSPADSPSFVASNFAANELRLISVLETALPLPEELLFAIPLDGPIPVRGP